MADENLTSDESTGHGSNHPPITVELPSKLVQFVLDNCNVNIAMGLGFLQICQDREVSRKLVEQIENFKSLRDLVQKEMS